MISTLLCVSFVFGLGSPRYSIREQLTTILSEAHPYSLIVEYAYNSRIPEVHMRSIIIRSRGINRILSKLEPFPSIDTVWYDTEKHMYKSLGKLKSSYDETIREIAMPIYKGRNYDGYPHQKYRDACRDLFYELIKLGYQESDLRVYLTELRHRDSIYYKNYGRPNPIEKVEVSK